jgi:hypothetical protein
MTDNTASTTEQSFRGPLKYTVETSAPQLEAGRKTSISLLISNPYDVPVTIIDANTVVPAQFRDANQEPKSAWTELWETAATEANLVKSHLISGESLTTDANVSADAPPVILQPGNTMIRTFTLRTKQKLFFTPSVHNLNAQVRYQMDDQINYDTVKYQLNIRAPFSALIIGSLFGALAGTMLRYKGGVADTPEEWWSFLAALGSGMVTASVLVIAFARKKDAQPFITIEDFWGGFFVGFVAAYVGESILKQVLPG